MNAARGLPEEVAALLRGSPDADIRAAVAHAGAEQAFPFLTVDGHGYPHSALLSRTELEPAPASGLLLAVVSGTRTRANLERDGRAGLIAVHGTVCSHLTLRLVGSRVISGEPGDAYDGGAGSESDGGTNGGTGSVLGCTFAVESHTAASLDIPLSPLGFRADGHIARLARIEQWERTATALATLRSAYGGEV
ncbi:hypothetical protein OG372_16250 [Streptomyces sp. NBC_01020]|uniref:hypothetical protein n=1 Tax=Streptomyces sp. NBC_01020 TaxID=2903722 RepID=UPI00386DE399|nr:hypothetical protein OG372_16250 [Streptomyces sp. NBC_01020]